MSTMKENVNYLLESDVCHSVDGEIESVHLHAVLEKCEMCFTEEPKLTESPQLNDLNETFITGASGHITASI